MKFKSIFFLLAVVLTALLSPSSLFAACLTKYDKQFEQSNVIVQWQFNHDGKTIDFSMTAPTTGWVAIGFNPSLKMRDAMIFIGYAKGNKAYLRHDYGHGVISHSALSPSQIIKFSGFEKAKKTTLCFRLPTQLKAPGGNGLNFKAGQHYTLIFAYGRDHSDSFKSYHQYRDSAKITL